MPDAKKLPPTKPIDILLLTLVAGSADAFGYLTLGKVFTSNMTGNIVLMGIALSEGRGDDTFRSLFALAAFIVGNCVGAWLWTFLTREKVRPGAITAVLGCEAVALLGYAATQVIVPSEHRGELIYPLIALLSLAMGWQAAAVYRMGTPGVTTTAITGTLTTLLNGLMRSINLASTLRTEMGHSPRFGLQAAVIVLYGGGAAIAGALNVFARPWAGFFPAVVVLIVIAARYTRRE